MIVAIRRQPRASSSEGQSIKALLLHHGCNSRNHFAPAHKLSAWRCDFVTACVAAASQFAFNTLSRVTPVAHGVCNVVKRVCIIGTSVIFFGNKMTDQTKLGTVIALIGENFVCGL